MSVEKAKLYWEPEFTNLSFDDDSGVNHYITPIKMITAKKLSVHIQYFNGCPHSSEMILRVKNAIADLDDKVDYKEILIETNELAEKLKFRGSPTLLINNEDFEGREEPSEISLSCRYYPKGLPSSEDIRKRLKELL